MRVLRALLPFLLVSQGWAAFSGSDSGTTAAGFLKLGVSARAISMGEAYSAVADDANALHWNPSGLTRIDTQSASVSHTAYLDSSFYDYLAYGKRAGKNAWGVGVGYLSSGDIAKTDDTGNDAGSFKPSDLSASLGYARAIGGGSIGLAGKLIRTRIVDSAQAFALDGGFLSPLFCEKFRFGASVSNLGGQIKYGSTGEDLPLLVRAGSSLQINKSWLASADVVMPRDAGPYAAIGTEVNVVNGEKVNLVGRAGYNTKASELDYGFLPFGSLGATHNISLSYRFAGSQKKIKEAVFPGQQKASLKVFGPIEPRKETQKKFTLPGSKRSLRN